MRFFDQLMASFPASLQPPEPLVRYFRWVDEQGLGVESRYALIDPTQSASEACMALTLVDAASVKNWLQTDDPLYLARLAPFLSTGGDGSCAALWLDDKGQVQIVHLGSGSGSVAVGVLVQNPIDLLRLLAIGYEEICNPEDYDRTPFEVFVENNGEEEDWDEDVMPPAVPVALQQWLVQEFGVAVPVTAAEVVCDMPSYGDVASLDPFYLWLHDVQRKHQS